MMITGIDGITAASGIASPFPAVGAKETAASPDGFTKMLGDMINKVNDQQLAANKSIENFSTGESKGLHEVMIAIEKSSISFQFLTQVRNKALDAYHEIMRMQV
jgi:flagellar hook-basal body complex protein FliE